MKKLLAAALGLVILAGVAHGAGSGPWGGTGDRTLDTTLQQITTQAKADPDGFIKQLSTRHGIPEQEIRQAQETQGLGPADLFMASALARASHRPVLSVAEEYKKNEGKGWGVMAKEMGIKPGSKEFHELKQGALGSLDHMKANAKARQKHERQMKREQEQKLKQGRDAEMQKGPQGKGHGKAH